MAFETFEYFTKNNNEDVHIETRTGRRKYVVWCGNGIIAEQLTKAMAIQVANYELLYLRSPACKKR